VIRIALEDKRAVRAVHVFAAFILSYVAVYLWMPYLVGS